MRIGKGKKNRETGRLTFDVRIPLMAPCTMELMQREADSRSDRAPDWHLLMDGETCGSLWRRIPTGGGEAFLSGYIETPVVPGGKLEIAIFTSKDRGAGGSQKDMVWRPRNDRPATAATPTSWARPAPQSAQSAPLQAPDDDDDIPF